MNTDEYWEDIPELIFEAFQDRIKLVEILIDESIPKTERNHLRHQYMELHNKSNRTVRRYIHLYKKKGARALLFYRKKEKPKRITDEDLLKKIIELIKESPSRSVPKLRRLLTANPEYRDKIAKYSNRTIYRFLYENGYDKKSRRCLDVSIYNRKAYHKFEASHSLALVQGDARDGIWLPGPNKKPVKTYLFLWIDDYSRKILFGKYYFSEKLYCLEDSFKHMTYRFGIGDKLYLDNGKVYTSRHFAFILNSLGTKKIHHKPYQAWCKGKIEVNNRTIKYDFQKEAELSNMQTIEELNTAFWAWCDLHYNKQIHTSTGQTPDERFLNGLQESQRRIIDVSWFESLFLWRENRTISKYGKIKLYKNEYAVTKKAYHTIVQVRFNPVDLSEVYIYDIEDNFLETTTPTKQLSIEAPSVPEESKKTNTKISKESQNYFKQLREKYLEEKESNGSGSFSSFYNLGKEEKNE